MSNSFDKITVVVPSVRTKDTKGDFLDMLVNTAGYPIDIVFVGENTEGLTTVYNRELSNSENDIVVFLHDDIEFLKKGWASEIVRIFSANKEYGILGIAGSKIFGTDGGYRWWADNDFCRGMLFHGDSTKSWITIFSDYNEDDVEEVTVIDGVLMACVKSRLNNGFDVSIGGFHFYDIDFCLSNFFSEKCKIGVTNRICLRHKSPGQVNEQWHENGKKILEKYKDKLPAKIKWRLKK